LVRSHQRQQNWSAQTKDNKIGQVKPKTTKLVKSNQRQQNWSGQIKDNKIGQVKSKTTKLGGSNQRQQNWVGQIKDYTISICCLSIKHAALRNKRKKLVGSEL
jgi:hypothetical protein